jgi:hypothetical protein
MGVSLIRRTPKDWPDTRILRSIFLETVLLHEPYRTAIPHQGVRIVGAWFKDSLDLSHASLVHRLWLHQSRFESKVDLSTLRTPHSLSLAASVFNASVDMSAIHSESYLSIARASPPYIFFLLNGDMELYRNKHLLV